MNRPRRKDRHLPANVHFKHGRHWYVKAGKWKALAKDPAEALREYADLIEKPRGGCGEMLGTAYTAMAEREGDGKLSPNTLKQYKAARDRLAKILAAFAPDQVKPKHVAAIKLALAKTPNMCNRILSFGRQAFDFALEAQLIESNPFVGIKRHREKKRTRLYSWEEWNAIYNGPRTGERLRLIMDGLYLTDQRIDDVLAIDERDGRPEGIFFDQGKTGTPLIIEWNEDLRTWWAKCLAQHAKVERVAFGKPDRPRPLFRTRHGTRPAYRTIYDQWVVAAAAAGVEDANMHDGRAFSATENEKQHGKKAAQDALGHKTEANTNRYLRDRSPKVVKGPTKKSA